ncbi:methyltransferase [Lithospermum erythrorhizon]|uniref:Methyltransferase n=1 Tax=Lithospermum erythrorhizon TaxID=34254 RepID=A0AAV3P5T2_LITER
MPMQMGTIGDSKRSLELGTVLLSYGTYTNLELLEHYGFLLNEYSNEKAFIVLEPDMYSLCSWPGDSLYICQNGKPSFALLSSLRLWATAPNQRRSSGHLACSGNLLSTDNEITVMKWLVKTCQGLLDALPTSVEQDELLGKLIKSAEDFPVNFEEQSSFIVELLSSLETNGIMDIIVGKRIKSISRFQFALKVKPDYDCTVLANG